MAFTGGFTVPDNDGDAACRHEREVEDSDRLPLYRLMFRFCGTLANPFVRVLFERLEGVGVESRWQTIDTAEGADERAAIKALRDARYEARSCVREMQRRAGGVS